VGLSLNKAYSLQRIELDINLVDYKYQNFDYLSFTARNYNAAWRWALTPRLNGNFTTDRAERLNSFADTQNLNTRNQRTNTNTRLDAVYDLGGSWRALAGVQQSKETNQQNLLAESNYATNSADLGVRYDLSSGSSLAYTRNSAQGQYLDRPLSVTGLFDDEFNQTTDEFRLRWLFSGNNSVSLNASYLNRSHPHFSQRDYSGLAAGVNVNWALTAKTALAASWARDLSSYQTSSTNFMQTDRLTLGPVWQLSPKALISLRYAVAQQDFLGTPTALAATQRSDTTRDTSLAFEWQPYQHITFSASLQNSTRSSNQANLDFDSNIANVSAQISY
jgi:exopolysaccharide biosynthesis operon protein EpsL